METMTKYKVQEVSWPEKSFLLKRERKKMDELTAFFKESFKAINEALKEKKLEMKGHPSAIYYSMDETKNEVDLAAAIPVNATVGEIGGFQHLKIAKAKALLVKYKGGYENIKDAYAALEQYASKHKLETQWKLEEYLTDPEVEKDPAKLETNVYYVLK